VTNLAWAYVAALFAAAVWLARRCGAAIPWRVAALFYALVLVFLFRPLTQQFVNFPADVIRVIPPWRVISPLDRTAVSNYEMQDVPMQMVPWAHQVRSAWRSLRLPLWNEMAGCGYPLLGNGQSAALSPIRLAALPVPMPYAMAAEAVMKLLVAMVGTFLFCRRRYGELPSVAGAVSYGFATYLISWLHFPHSTVAAFLPVAILGADLVTERPSGRRVAFAALAWAATIFGGHPETIADSALLIFGFVVWVAIVERREIKGVAIALPAALLIASPFLVPLVETLLRSERRAEIRLRAPSGIPFSDAPSLALLVQPRFYGALQRPQAWGPAAAESISGFAGILGFAGFAAVLVSAIRRRQWRERDVFFALAAIVIVVVLADLPPLGKLVNLLLPLSTNNRIRVLLCFCAAILTAAFMARLRDERRASFIGIVFALVALGYPFWVWRGAFPTFDSVRPSLLAIVPSFAVLLIAATGLRVVLPIAIAAELWIALHGWNAVIPASESYWRTPLIRRLEGLRSLQREPFRIAGVSESMFPNTQAMFGFEDARVHDPMANERYTRWLESVTDYHRAPYYAKLVAPSSKLLGFLNVRYVVLDPGAVVPDPQRYRVAYDGPDGKILENLDVRQRFFSNDARVEILGAAPSDYRLRVSAARPAVVISSIAAYPGWRVVGAGGRVTINGVFLGFRASAGTSEVRVRYVPLSFYIPLVISLLTIAGLIWCVRRSPQPAPEP
jgi:hypothetical protein